MDVEQGLEVANSAVLAKTRRRLSPVEAAILSGSWQGQTYEEIALSTHYAASYLKRYAGPKLWQLLSDALGEAVSKTNFRASLEHHYQQESEGVQAGLRKLNLESGKPNSEQSTETPSPCIDWGEATDVSTFYGRQLELDLLHQWIKGKFPAGRQSHSEVPQTSRCRMICLLGMGGIGKTSLSIKLAQQIASSQPEVGDRSSAKSDSPFEFVI